MNNDGTLTVDSSTLEQRADVSNPAAVQNFFTNANSTGFADNFNADLTNLTDPSTGILNQDLTENQSEQNRLNTEITNFQTQLAAQTVQLDQVFDTVNANLEEYPFLLEEVTAGAGVEHRSTRFYCQHNTAPTTSHEHRQDPNCQQHQQHRPLRAATKSKGARFMNMQTVVSRSDGSRGKTGGYWWCGFTSRSSKIYGKRNSHRAERTFEQRSNRINHAILVDRASAVDTGLCQGRQGRAGISTIFMTSCVRIWCSVQFFPSKRGAHSADHGPARGARSLDQG